MDRVVQIRVDGGGPGGWVAGRPSLAARIALVTFLVIVGVPLALLLGMAVAAAVLVFGGLALLGAANRRLRSLMPGGDGRSNVRVIQRDDTVGPP